MPIDPPANDTLPALLTRAASLSPDRPALLAPGHGDLAYAGLLAQRDGMVAALGAFGIGREDRVALALPAGPALATTFLAVASHAVCAPLNPRYRADEFEFTLADLHARALVVEAGADSAARVAARALGIDVIELVPEPGVPAGRFTLRGAHRGNAAVRPARADDVALVLHTSGSTARPKRVPLTHRNLCASARHVADTLRLGPEDRGLCVMPLFHIHGLVAGLLAPLAVGSQVVCAPAFSPESFFACLDGFRPSWYSAVPTMHQAILAHAEAHPSIVSSSRLRFVRSSSSSLPVPVMAELEALFRAPVIEAYGMTEAAHQVASNPLPPRERKPGSVGPAAGPEIAIVGADGAFLGPGQRGEVVIRGANVMPGYENAAAAREASVGDGWLRTGDEGHLDADGYLVLDGRLKDIVNRGGEKVSPHEVDDALMAHPAVAQAIAFAVPHDRLGEDLAAAVVLRRGASVAAPALREYLFERLADFKVPSQVLVVDAIPQGASGKLQRNGLADHYARLLLRERVAPRDAHETVLAQVFEEVLGVESAGVDDNFFALGGDSLQGMEVTMRIQAIFNIDLGGAAVFHRPTVALLADAIRERQQAAR
jgi:acyl-CoA synthetase (AMP-forming)/AMP-acid ligase II/acyl carrier protein